MILCLKWTDREGVGCRGRLSGALAPSPDLGWRRWALPMWDDVPEERGPDANATTVDDTEEQGQNSLGLSYLGLVIV